jgi:hypothetical protein
MPVIPGNKVVDKKKSNWKRETEKEEMGPTALPNRKKQLSQPHRQ